jgi:hypothetical protein
VTLLPQIGGVPNIKPLQLAVAALPGYLQAVELAAEADKWLRQQPELRTVPDALRAHITDEWIDAERARATALAEYEAKRSLVQGRLLEAATSAQSILSSGVDLILGALQGNLTQLLDDTGQLVAELGGAATAEQAIAADASPAWRQLTALAADYQDLRSAQGWVMMRAPQQIWRSCLPDLPGEDHANEAFIKNINDIWPAWRQGGPAHQTTYLGHDAPTPVRHEPWPVDNGPELLCWLVTSNAQP